jgi:hypothetical protein
MKLLVDTKANHVLYAEVNKDVVDFLFSLLALPVATIVNMLGKGSLTGSFGNVYSSVEKLDDTYILPGAEKSAVLQPAVVPSAASTTRSSLLLPAPSSGQSLKSFFQCKSSNYSGCCDYVTDTRGTMCPSCRTRMNVALKFAPPNADSSGYNLKNSGAAKGFVQGVVTYTVSDDLTVTPMSTISTITLLNTATANIGNLQEKTVQLGYTEVMVIDPSTVSFYASTSLLDLLEHTSRLRIHVHLACFAGFGDCQGVDAVQDRPH